MTFEDFIEQVTEQILSYLPEEYEGADVMVQEVTKNNDQKLLALCIKRPEDRIVPNIYLESFYQMVQNGRKINKVLNAISLTHQESMRESAQWQDFRVGKYDTVKDNLYVMVLNREKNREYLTDIVHQDIPDTDITAVLRVLCGRDQEKGNASFLVKESMLEAWGVSGEGLLEQALKNTERLFPPKMLDLANIMYLDADDSILSKKLESYSQYVLTNDTKVHGAATLLFPNLLQEIGEATGGSFFILPSSIHETILIKDNGEMSAEELQRMVMEVNRTQVSPEEVLSDEVYCYDYRERKLTMATDPAQTKEYVEQMAGEFGCEDSMEEAEAGEMER
ncbi:MAG: hypothetical protein HFH83_01415 [Lachnospiraceae bacterium]|jgi:hypothetical protein|nr:hypothetical protein [Lachnospiraceae bacterium]